MISTSGVGMIHYFAGNDKLVGGLHSLSACHPLPRLFIRLPQESDRKCRRPAGSVFMKPPVKCLLPQDFRKKSSKTQEIPCSAIASSARRTPFVWGCGSPVIKVSYHSRHVMSSSPVPLKTSYVGQQCTLNLSRAKTSSSWCGVVVRRGDASSGVIHVT
ncbi:hypothetical protein TNCV_2487611 [Trichonephila clavipes]|uniref:Uncharacterized protein n=1 Tax=Trichonephila clavipes TaxID=2585209 RepID=A0A8X6W0D5_TRICX|nr:hypothetical protein TNCV_2487611 [Trichonephila clavipes]